MKGEGKATKKENTKSILKLLSQQNNQAEIMENMEKNDKENTTIRPIEDN